MGCKSLFVSAFQQTGYLLTEFCDFKVTNKVVIELCNMQFWSKIILAIALHAHLISRMISEQTALHSVQLPLFLHICVGLNVEWSKALKFLNKIIEHLSGKSETFHSTLWCTTLSWMGRWVINSLTVELYHLFSLGFFRNDNNWLKSAINPSPASAHFIVCL